MITAKIKYDGGWWGGVCHIRSLSLGKTSFYAVKRLHQDTFLFFKSIWACTTEVELLRKFSCLLRFGYKMHIQNQICVNGGQIVHETLIRLIKVTNVYLISAVTHRWPLTKNFLFAKLERRIKRTCAWILSMRRQLRKHQK